MTFRDEREALRARNDALEGENRELRERIEEMRRAAEPPPPGEPAGPPPAAPEKTPGAKKSTSWWSGLSWVLWPALGLGGCGYLMCQHPTRRPDIELPEQGSGTFRATVTKAQGVQIEPGTACDVRFDMKTNRTFAALHSIVVRCGELSFSAASSDAAWIETGPDGLALSSFGTPSSGSKSSGGSPGHEIDTAAGGMILYGGPQPLWMELRVDPKSARLTAGPGPQGESPSGHRRATHDVKWKVGRRADDCYFLSGPEGRERYLGRRAALDEGGMEFWGGGKLERSGDGQLQRTFVSAEPTHYKVRERISLRPIEPRGFTGEYHYDECDGPKCGQCAFDATLEITPLPP